MASLIRNYLILIYVNTVYPKKYAHGFVVLYFVVVMQSFIMISHEVFIHIHHGCFAGTGAIVRLPQCQWSKPDGYGKISQYITTTKHSKAKTLCIFLGIYCMSWPMIDMVRGSYSDNLPQNQAKFRICMTPWASSRITIYLVFVNGSNIPKLSSMSFHAVWISNICLKLVLALEHISETEVNCMNNRTWILLLDS